MVANWKMHKTVYESRAFARELIFRVEKDPRANVTTEVICPTLVALADVARQLASSPIRVGAQTLDLGREGANTGAVSGYLLREAGAGYVIIGHSERRTLYGEDDALVGEKTAQALKWGLVPIVCVGESQSERESGRTDDIIRRQVAAVVTLANPGEIIWAYEPVWAIGTGLVADPAEVNRVAGLIRAAVQEHTPDSAARARILYGGSVTRHNVGELAQQPLINGALVGGASLDVEHWLDLNRIWGEVVS